MNIVFSLFALLDAPPATRHCPFNCRTACDSDTLSEGIHDPRVCRAIRNDDDPKIAQRLADAQADGVRGGRDSAGSWS